MKRDRPRRWIMREEVPGLSYNVLIAGGDSGVCDGLKKKACLGFEKPETRLTLGGAYGAGPDGVTVFSVLSEYSSSVISTPCTAYVTSPSDPITAGPSSL